MSRAALALAGLIYLTACEEWHLSINSNGLVLISVIGDAGEPRHRFRLRSRDAGGMIRILDVPPSGDLALAPVSDGELQLTLLAPEGCWVAGPNPQTLSVSGGQAARVAFNVRCG